MTYSKLRMASRRKSPAQLQALEGFYAEDRYPKQCTMESYARVLELTYKQVRGWFIERRRKDKREMGSAKEMVVPSTPSSSLSESSSLLEDLKKKRKLEIWMKRNERRRDGICRIHGDGAERIVKLQDMLWTSDHIIKTIFRKDGPPLGSEFDSLPSGAFCRCRPDSPLSAHANQIAAKRRKVKAASRDYQECNERIFPVKKYGVGKGLMTDLRSRSMKHGIGKGLMTVWRATNHAAGGFPASVDMSCIESSIVYPFSSTLPRKQPQQKKSRKQRIIKKPERIKNKVPSKRKPPPKSREAVNKQPRKTSCELALGGVTSEGYLDQFALLEDDEEVELRELHAGEYPRTCSAHFAANGISGCSLCKDLLAKFPPTNVKMKQPISMQPWSSSTEMVKKMFKVFHVLYTYAAVINVSPFTLDEFAQAFLDKDSLLLGEVHVALLKFLLHNIDTELSNGLQPRLSTSCKFLGLLQMVQDQKHVVDFWKKSLNPLTWTEIMRQVLVAAGYGFNNGTLQRQTPSKEVSRIAKYGLHPGTLKGELFSILSEHGNNGMKVSELAKSSKIGKLNLTSVAAELEVLISSALSSDITLFEKIAPSVYRLRINFIEESDNFLLEAEDSGSVDNESEDIETCSSSDDSECDSEISTLSRTNPTNEQKKHRNQKLVKCTEIDESHPGEIWLLGLMEGEYSDLSVEEKLNTLVSLVDLLSAGSSFRMESRKAREESICQPRQYSSGGKIKRSSAMDSSVLVPLRSHVVEKHSSLETNTQSELHPVDSSSSVANPKLNDYSTKDVVNVDNGSEKYLHTVQSVFLGSDRRYNRYWLFLGPCDDSDPGHCRIYFESSEDGHWEAIETEEDLCALLSVLDNRGRREAALIASLKQREAPLQQAMSKRTENWSGLKNLTHPDRSELDMVRDDGSSPVSGVDNNPSLTETGNNYLAASGALSSLCRKNGEDQKQKLSRLRAFDSWIWNSFYSGLNAVKHSKRSYLDSLARCGSCHDLYWRDEKHCRICHTTFELDFDLEEKFAVHAATCRQKGKTEIRSKLLSSQLQSLKAAVHAIESVLPEDALIGVWRKAARKLWVKRLRRTSSLTELLQVLTDFVGAINEDWLCQCDVATSSSIIVDDIMASFPPLPLTASAVALWLVKLDNLISPYLQSRSVNKQHRQGQGELMVE